MSVTIKNKGQDIKVINEANEWVTIIVEDNSDEGNDYVGEKIILTIYDIVDVDVLISELEKSKKSVLASKRFKDIF